MRELDFTQRNRGRFGDQDSDRDRDQVARGDYDFQVEVVQQGMVSVKLKDLGTRREAWFRVGAITLKPTKRTGVFTMTCSENLARTKGFLS